MFVESKHTWPSSTAAFAHRLGPGSFQGRSPGLTSAKFWPDRVCSFACSRMTSA